MTDPGEDDADIEIVVIADEGPRGGGSSGSVFVPVKDPFKTGLQLNAALFSGAAVIVLAAGPVSLGGAVVVGSAFALIGIGLGYAALDPPQTDFAHPVQAGRLSLGLGADATPEPGRAEMLELLDSANVHIGLVRGLLDSMERFQGARDAGDDVWAVGHARGAALLAACAVTKQLQLAAQLERLGRRVEAFELSASHYEDVVQRAGAGDLLPDRTRDRPAPVTAVHPA